MTHGSDLFLHRENQGEKGIARTRIRHADSSPFTALLAELEEKRQWIYSQMGTQDIVRFVYKNSNDCVPLVVKLKDEKDDKIESGATNNHRPQRGVSEVTGKLQTPSGPDRKIEKKKSFSWNAKLQNLRRPSHYIPAVIILILLSLVFFGRSVAILCTCIGWYMVSTISEEGSNLRTSMKKKIMLESRVKTKGCKWESIFS
ncbi:hypothetical protein V6N13_141186 [Hibiscus sabdariffa]|uniref:Uncharacterized protein n=1 Tax=Hibiscus sabdariffa TaxID=183260 RepID=A0ABR2Q198_9ROSI